MAPKLNPDWPVLTCYDQDHLARIALPLGGIGTGTVSLGGRGDLRDWEIANRPAKGFAPRNAFFALWAKPAGGEPVTRCLEGALEPPYEGSTGCVQPNHGLPRFRACTFHAAYPLAQVALSDADVPLDVRIEAFNPLVPGDPDASGVPVAVLRFVLVNRGSRPVDASVCGSLQNYIGSANAFHTGRGLRGVLLTPEGRDPADEQFGTIALSTLASRGVTHRTAWARLTWGDSLLDFWDDFSDDGRLDERNADGAKDPRASLAVSTRVPARGTRTLTFLLTWHFPNRMGWEPEAGRVGNYYTTQYADAWDVAEQTARALPRLEADTARFVRSVCESDLPHAVKDAALCNLTGLRSQTSFRTEDGRFYGWEGCHDTAGCCPGSCTHVWNYEQATAFLFGSLARSMRETEFLLATDDTGHMCFRVGLPLDQARRSGLAAADGQMGCLLKLYRDWQLSGDDALLDRLWPRAKQALAFAWRPGGWDADRDGVMEGCQHNTMDVEYYGPNPQMAGWYLGALRAGEEMARHVGDDAFADTCRDLFTRGSRWVDAHLFNGDYYEHEIRPPASEDAIAPGLRHGSMGARDLAEPDLQLGAGCLVDQLVGQFVAHACGLGHLLSRRNVRKTLRSIVRYNFQKGLHGHFNHLRTFALNDESALLMATYPRGRRPKRPFPYYNEVMTGFEYTAAVHMLYEGQTAAGLRCIEAIRARYDGRRRSPFNEAECGHHYARAMTSWGAILALTGFHYSGVEQHLTFKAAAEKATWFWSNGDAWGTVRQTPRKGRIDVELAVQHGTLRLRRLTLDGAGTVEFPPTKTIGAARAARFRVPDEGVAP